ncbi:MAG: hypothetical protein R2991_15190 [Thermoanaerobaculia bacterium]
MKAEGLGLGGVEDLPDVDAQRLVGDLELVDEAVLTARKTFSVSFEASATSGRRRGVHGGTTVL